MDRGIKAFYWQIVCRAFSGKFWYAEKISGGVALFFAFVAAIFGWDSAVNWVPFFVFSALFFSFVVVGLIYAPYFMWLEGQQQIVLLESKIKGHLEFMRDLAFPEGDCGFYVAYITAKNTSLTEKLRDCRCEIAELRDGEGLLIEKNIGLRTRGQENKETQGRFNLDQDSTKDLPVFDIDQSREDGLVVVNANKWDIRLDHGRYTARIRGYGDRGEPDEMTVLIDSRDGRVEVIPNEAVVAKTGGVPPTRRTVEPSIALSEARLRLVRLRAEGVKIRNDGQRLGQIGVDFNAWNDDVGRWEHEVMAAIRLIDSADAEWFATLDAVPEPRVAIYFHAKHNEGAHLKAFREHDYRLLRLDRLIEKYGNRVSRTD